VGAFLCGGSLNNLEEQAHRQATTFASGRLVLDAVLAAACCRNRGRDSRRLRRAQRTAIRIIATLNHFEPFDLVESRPSQPATDLKGRRIGRAQGTNAHYFYSKILASSACLPRMSLPSTQSGRFRQQPGQRIDRCVRMERAAPFPAMSMGEGKFHIVQFPGLYVGYSRDHPAEYIDKEPQTLSRS